MIDKQIQNKKQKYAEVKGKCRTCLGCNLLEDLNFAGYYRCDNYARGEDDTEDGSSRVIWIYVKSIQQYS